MILLETGVKHKRVEIPMLTRHNVCNPSIMATEYGFDCTVRGVNYDLEKTNLEYVFFYGSYAVPFPDTQNYYLKLDNDLNILDYWFLEDRHLRCDVFSLDGVEDLRLFNWKGAPYIMGNAINYPSQSSNMTLMSIEGNVLDRMAMFMSPTKSPVEKNWMPYVQGDMLNFIYTPNGQLLTYSGTELEFTHQDRGDYLPNWSGSSCLMKRGDKYYAIVHQRIKSIYTHKLVEYDVTGLPIWQSQEFSFERVGIEFCAGMAFKGDDVVISYGIMDKQAILLQMKFDDFFEAVK